MLVKVVLVLGAIVSGFLGFIYLHILSEQDELENDIKHHVVENMIEIDRKKFHTKGISFLLLFLILTLILIVL